MSHAATMRVKLRVGACLLIGASLATGAYAVRQGGDTCATATVIPALPFTAEGTTFGYASYFGAMCPYGDQAPDVVYTFTPTADMSVDITTCTGITDYDSKLLVYEDDCQGVVHACNQDACMAPNYPYPAPYVAELLDVPLLAEHAYYIIVDAYGDEEGNYTIDILQTVIHPGDWDSDLDVDLDDYAAWPHCMGGPGQTPGFIMPSTPCRETFDYDGDNDVDIRDVAAFQRAFGQE